MQLIDGKKISSQIKEEVRQEVDKIRAEGGRAPHLAAVLVGSDPASETYVSSKVKSCKKVGFESSEFRYEETITEEFLLNKIKELNLDNNVDGILVQLPLPDHISETTVIEAIHPAKDVDGFHPINIGRMSKGLPAVLPATPAGIMELIRRYNIETKGKKAVIIGKSNIVGLPLSVLMAQDRDGGRATVTTCDIHTSKAGILEDYTLEADIIVVAAGVPGLLKANMVKDGVVVIDVGINRVPDDSKKRGYRLVGDVDFDEVSKKSEFITPVPGGVGPMTIAMLLRNTLQAYKERLQDVKA